MPLVLAWFSSGRLTTEPISPIAAPTSSTSSISRARPTSGAATRWLSIMKANRAPTM